MAIVKMLDLSTGHVTKETAEWLNLVADRTDTDFPIVYSKGEYGWIVHSYPSPDFEPPENTPKDLLLIMALAVRKKCDWIMLDRDGDIITQLPVYDW